jgi:hypothetical protein
MRFRRFDQPGVPFITYYPSDMVLETAASEEGQAVRFLANMGGKKNASALLHIFLFPAGTEEKAARGLVQTAAGSRGVQSLKAPSGPRRRWAVVEYSLARKGYSGSIALGKHGSRWFHVLLDYPVSYADGLVPRADQILKELRWRDTGRGLSEKG